MIKTLRLELTVEVDGSWPGDDAVNKELLKQVPAGVIDMGEECVLLIRSMTAEVVKPYLSS